MFAINATSSSQPHLLSSPHSGSDSVYHDGDQIFRMGDQLDNIYLVNSGAVKLFTITESGEEHIVRFCMPGDILGLEVLGDGVSKTNAMILSIANITALPLSTVMGRGAEFDLGGFVEHIANTLTQETEHCMIVSQATAGRRVAWFLSEYAAKLTRRGLVANTFDMPMTRSEMGLYLGLAVETVSRELAKLCKKGILKKQLKHIEITDMAALQAVAKNSMELH